jgi:S1-C subfamily serine protease
VKTGPVDPVNGGTGARIASTVPGGPANRAGLQIGEVIKSVVG